MQVLGITNQGMERARNEDNCIAVMEADLALLAVADGMGGHRAGNVASALAVQEAEQLWSEIDKKSDISVKKARMLVEKLFNNANQKIFEEAEKGCDKKGMGTTLTAGLICGNRLTIGHVGDSRAYKIQEGKIVLLTRDHSLVGQLIECGQVAPEEADNHPQRHILTRALGVSPVLDIDFTEMEIEPGSLLLFCTDGLTNLARDHDILELYNKNPDPAVLAEALIDLANARGGFDNITVVIASHIGGLHD